MFLEANFTRLIKPQISLFSASNETRQTYHQTFDSLISYSCEISSRSALRVFMHTRIVLHWECRKARKTKRTFIEKALGGRSFLGRQKSASSRLLPSSLLRLQKALPCTLAWITNNRSGDSFQLKSRKTPTSRHHRTQLSHHVTSFSSPLPHHQIAIASCVASSLCNVTLNYVFTAAQPKKRQQQCH